MIPFPNPSYSLRPSQESPINYSSESRPRTLGVVKILVAVAILLFVPDLGAQVRGAGGADTPPTLILHGGTIVTGGSGGGSPTALAVLDGRVVLVGSDQAVMARRGSNTRMVDLRGGVVVPSFKDHHVHVSGAGFALLNQVPETRTALDVRGRDPQEIGEMIRERATKLPPGEWILGRGWNHLGWGTDTLPKHDILTLAAPGHPVFLGDSDAHVGWVNLEALRRAGIDANTPDPAGGLIFRYPNGRPTGVLTERAADLVIRLIPPPSDEAIQEAFTAGANAFAAWGITEVYDATFIGPDGVANHTLDFGRYLRLLAAADRREPLPIRINVMIMSPSPFADTLLADPAPFRSLSPNVGVTHIKIFADGAFARRGAYLTHPYPVEDPDTIIFGVPRMTPEEIYSLVTRAIDVGLDVGTHAIGDAAVRRVLDVYEAVLRDRPNLEPRRLRIEHFSYGLPGDYERAARLGIVLVIQPNFISPFYERWIGEERGAQILALRDHLDAGTELAGSTDSYRVPQGIWGPFTSGVTRGGGSSRGPWHPEQNLTREEALELFTRYYPPGGGPPRLGRIEAGEVADIVVLSADPRSIAVERIRDIEVHATLRRGAVTYTDGSISGLQR